MPTPIDQIEHMVAAVEALLVTRATGQITRDDWTALAKAVRVFRPGRDDARDIFRHPCTMCGEDRKQRITIRDDETLYDCMSCGHEWPSKE